MINRYRFKMRLFLSFLKEHGCYEKYKESYCDIEKIFLMNERDIIWYSLTFYVKRTLPKDKVNFWCKIDRLWGNVIFVNTVYN